MREASERGNDCGRLRSIRGPLRAEGRPAVAVPSEVPPVQLILIGVAEELRVQSKKIIRSLVKEQIGHDSDRVEEERDEPQRVPAVPVPCDQSFILAYHEVVGAGRGIEIKGGAGRQAQCDDQQDRRQAACEKHVQPPFHETVITGKECSKRQTDCPGENLGGLSGKRHKILEVLDIMRSTVFAKLFIGGIAYPPYLIERGGTNEVRIGGRYRF